MPLSEKSRASSHARIATTVIHGIARAQRLEGGEIVVPVRVHGVLHGLRVTERLARELMAELEAALAAPPIAGQPAHHRAQNYAEAAAIGAPLTKPNGQVF